MSSREHPKHDQAEALRTCLFLGDMIVQEWHIHPSPSVWTASDPRFEHQFEATVIVPWGKVDGEDLIVFRLLARRRLLVGAGHAQPPARGARPGRGRPHQPPNC